MPTTNDWIVAGAGMTEARRFAVSLAKSDWLSRG